MPGWLRTIGLLVLGGLLLGGLVWWRSPSKQTGSGTGPGFERTNGGYRLNFEPRRGTTARGRATLRPADTAFTIVLRLWGLREDARYNVHLHRGNCRDGGGGGRALEPVTAGPEGTGEAESTVAYGDLNPTFDHLIMVHEPEGHHVLCAEVPTVGRMRSVGEASRSRG